MAVESPKMEAQNVSFTGGREREGSVLKVLVFMCLFKCCMCVSTERVCVCV